MTRNAFWDRAGGCCKALWRRTAGRCRLAYRESDPGVRCAGAAQELARL